MTAFQSERANDDKIFRKPNVASPYTVYGEGQAVGVIQKAMLGEHPLVRTEDQLKVVCFCTYLK